MTAKYLPVFVLFVLASVAGAADTIHPLDVRPGMWENTMTVQTAGIPSLPPEVLARLTPEQKAAMETRMKEMAGKPTVTKHCLTKEELDKPLMFGSTKGECKRTVAVSTSTRQEIQIQCESGSVKTNGTIRIEAIDPEHIKVSSHMTSGDGPRAMTVDANGTGKWLSAGCRSESGK